MASSNRHWPSLFKSKACNPHNQAHHDMLISSSTLLSGACQKPNSFSASGTLPGCEERSPEPKPRWNPKPEQIRILEAIFNSGMVNPPRDEIRRIRTQLQEYGQVGDANVFYWFQNRKSRSKQKQRHLQAAGRQQQSRTAPPPPTEPVPATSSSSSSERSSAGPDHKVLPPGMTTANGVPATAIDVAANLPAALVNQSFLHGDFFPDPFYFQTAATQTYCLSAADLPSLVALPEQELGLCTGLFSDLSSPQIYGLETKLHHRYGLSPASAGTAGASAMVAAAVASAANATAGSTYNAANSDSTIAGHIGCIVPGMGNGLASIRPTVFINEVAFEVGTAGGLLNVREAFGEGAVLLHTSGHPVPVDERGVTLHPLQHGASYYLV